MPKKYTYKVDRKMKDYGEIDEKKRKIRINPKKREVVNSAIHEDLHKKHPNKTEEEIKKKAKKKESNMSISQIIKTLGKYKRKPRLRDYV